MKRQEYTGTLEITGGATESVTRYAHNSAMRAAIDLLRNHAHGGYWRQESVTKTAAETMVDYRHDDGREARVPVARVPVARVTVARPTA